MKTYPPDEPEFACARCLNCMCEDCLSLAAEYEFLYAKQKSELVRAADEVEILSAELANWKRIAEAFQQIAKMGYSAVIRGYLDSLVQK